MGWWKSLGINLEKIDEIEEIEKIAENYLKDAIRSYHIEPNEFIDCQIKLRDGEVLGFNDLSKFVSNVADVLGVSTTEVVVSHDPGHISIGFPR